MHHSVPTTATASTQQLIRIRGIEADSLINANLHYSSSNLDDSVLSLRMHLNVNLCIECIPVIIMTMPNKPQCLLDFRFCRRSYHGFAVSMQQIVSLSDDDADPRDIVHLSDEEVSRPNPVAHRPPSKPKQSSVEQCHQHARKLTRVVKNNCRRKLVNCREPWRKSEKKFDELLQLRLSLHEMGKLDADEEAANI